MKSLLQVGDVKHSLGFGLVQVDLDLGASCLQVQEELDLSGANLNLLDISPVVLFNLFWRFEHISGNFKEENSICVDCEED